MSAKNSIYWPVFLIVAALSTAAVWKFAPVAPIPDDCRAWCVKMVKRLRGEATEQTAKSLWADMGDLELTKARKAKKMQLTRCENQLNYQSNRREAERKPMPDGPKRHQIESKLKTLQAELRDMDLEISRRGI